MSAAPRAGFEAWSWAAFALAAATAGLFFYLGLRPGGTVPVLAYRFGPLLLGAAAAVGMLLALFLCWRRRPALQRGRVWPLVALGGSLWFCSLPIAYPSSHEGKFSPTRFRLPFEGSARVSVGGEERARNPLLFDPARRFGTAFEALRPEGLSVLAPAAGTLSARHAGRTGEVLVLQTGAAEFCVLAGLDGPSCPWVVGDRVDAGQALGRAPGRLLVHLQDGPEPGRREGIPMRFWGYRADGRLAEAGVPIPPQEVANAGSEPAGGAPGR